MEMSKYIYIRDIKDNINRFSFIIVNKLYKYIILKNVCIIITMYININEASTYFNKHSK